MTTTDPKTRIITLSNRPPVKIKEDEWPVIGKASWSDNAAIPSQANRSASVRVRRHADGRSLVYGTYESKWQGEPVHKTGRLLKAGSDVAAAINEVVNDLGVTAIMAAECIADLPAEEI